MAFVPVNENPTWFKVKVKDKEGKKEGYILESDIEKISAHDWVAFGFKISKLYPNHFVLSSQDNYLKMIWEELGNEGDVNKEELTDDLTEQVMSRKLSKLICLHNSEWGVEYSSLETEVTAYFDKIIAEADSNVKEDLETKKTAALEALKTQIENSDFWSKVKVASNEPEGIPSFGNDASSDSQTPSYMAWGEAQAEESTTIPFPTSAKVYHFHPIAFVEQMMMMSADLVYEIYHTGKIVENGDYEKAKEVSFVYHDKNGGKHMLGIYTLTEVDTYSNGVKKKKLPKNVNLFDYEAKFSSVYKCDLYYKKRNGKVKTIDISEHMSGNRSGSSNVMLHFNYKSGNFKINFYAQTSRRYAKPECFAAIIGVVVDTGYSDIKINGFTSKDGTGSPSSTHPGGMKVDISNLDTETIKPTASVDTYDANYSRDRTYALCKSLITFGYKSIVTADDVNQKKNTTNIILKSDHTNHLHCQGFIRNK